TPPHPVSLPRGERGSMPELMLRARFYLLCLYSRQRTELRFGVLPHIGEHFAGEECHVFAREVIGQAAELWQGEDMADLELQRVFEQLLAHGLRAADQHRTAGLDIVPTASMT